MYNKLNVHVLTLQLNIALHQLARSFNIPFMQGRQCDKWAKALCSRSAHYLASKVFFCAFDINTVVSGTELSHLHTPPCRCDSPCHSLWQCHPRLGQQGRVDYRAGRR